MSKRKSRGPTFSDRIGLAIILFVIVLATAPWTLSSSIKKKPAPRPQLA